MEDDGLFKFFLVLFVHGLSPLASTWFLLVDSGTSRYIEREKDA